MDEVLSEIMTRLHQGSQAFVVNVRSVWELRDKTPQLRKGIFTVDFNLDTDLVFWKLILNLTSI